VFGFLKVNQKVEITEHWDSVKGH